jgi:hypothetical protein
VELYRWPLRWDSLNISICIAFAFQCQNHELGKTLVIERKRIFLFCPKTNIRQEYAAEYSADNEYSAQGSKHCNNSNLDAEQKCFLGWQMQVVVN